MKAKYIVIGIVLFTIGFGMAWFFKPVPETSAGEPTQQASNEIWTCSMHPQIRQNEPGQCPLCGMDLIPMDEMTSGNPMVLEMTEEAVRLAHIQTTVIGQTGNADQGSRNRIVLNGKLQADERSASSLTAHLPGRIEKLYVGFTGEYVSNGQRIARVYSPNLITAQRELIEAKRISDLSPALLNAAKNKLKYWKLPDQTIEEILEEEVIRETFDIYAEASGIVTRKRVQVGDHVMDGSVLFDVQSLSNLWVVFEAYESDLPSIRIGDKIQFTTPAVPGKTFTTSVSFIDPVIDPSTRIARIRGNISNRSGQLKPEMFVTGNISRSSAAQADIELIVPKSSVLWTGERSVVYRKVQDVEIPSFEFREVLLGEPVSGGYLIAEGLEAGDVVVTNGAFFIDASAQLNNQASMMNRDVDIKSTELHQHTINAADRGPEYTSKYVCPMHCEGSGSDEPGRCPVCNIKYIENEDFESIEPHNH